MQPQPHINWKSNCQSLDAMEVLDDYCLLPGTDDGGGGGGGTGGGAPIGPGGRPDG